MAKDHFPYWWLSPKLCAQFFKMVMVRVGIQMRVNEAGKIEKSRYFLAV